MAKYEEYNEASEWCRVEGCKEEVFEGDGVYKPLLGVPKRGAPLAALFLWLKAGREA